MKIKYFISLLFIVLTVSSCGNSLSPDGYVEYVESSSYPYKVTKKLGDKEFTMVFTPNEYLVLKQLNDYKSINEDIFKSEMKGKEGFLHFVFTIKGNNNNEAVMNESSNLDSYNNDLMYMVNDLQSDFILKKNGKIFPCVFANYERNYGLTNINNVQVVFEMPDDLKNIKVVYNDKIFNTGPITFDFKDIKPKKLKI